MGYVHRRLFWPLLKPTSRSTLFAKVRSYELLLYKRFMHPAVSHVRLDGSPGLLESSCMPIVFCWFCRARAEHFKNKVFVSSADYHSKHFEPRL